MKTGLAIWHYPQRTLAENIAFFAGHGFESLSSIGSVMVKHCLKEAAGEQLAAVLRQTGIELTVHHKLPDLDKYSDAEFYRDICLMRTWQEQHGLLSILSFDVPQSIRDRQAGAYIDFVLRAFEGTATRVAVEDYGLNDAERAQLAPFEGNPRFGLLIDIGHMNIRLSGGGNPLRTLFAPSGEGAPRPVGDNGYEAFCHAFACKTFPIFEIHLHNNDGKLDLHNFLECGTVQAADIARTLRTVGYDGVVTIESVPGCHGLQGDVGDERILQTYAYWKEILLREGLTPV